MSKDSRDLVPFFNKDKSQIIFEFVYIITLFLAIVWAFYLVQFRYSYEFDAEAKNCIFAALGGLLGGWAYVAKWFYRVVAKGKDHQYPWDWQIGKFYWRILAPFTSCAIAFASYSVLSAGIINIKVGDDLAPKGVLGLCFFLGYFSDVVLSRVAKRIEKMLSADDGGN